jgi:hypothetical protein
LTSSNVYVKTGEITVGRFCCVFTIPIVGLKEFQTCGKIKKLSWLRSNEDILPC